MYEAYRVLKPFDWRGWRYAPKDSCKCGCEDCTEQAGTGCEACPPGLCNCACNIPKEIYAGDIWFVESGHPRKETMLEHRKAVYDDSIGDVETLLKKPIYSRLLQQPGEPAPRRSRKKPKPALVGTERI